MNFAKALPVFLLLATQAFVFASDTSDTIDYGKANPPWKPDKRYSVVSTYDMELRNIVLDLRLIRPAEKKVVLKGTWFEHTRTRNEKEKGHYTSSPFTGTYNCKLNYTTFATALENKNNGSTFREYLLANVEFQPKDKNGRTVVMDAKTNWVQKVLRIEPFSVKMENGDVADKVEGADFMFRDVFETDGRHLDDTSWYFLAWTGRDAFRGDVIHHMDVHKRKKAIGRAKDAEQEALSSITQQGRNRISQDSVGNDISGNWDRVNDQDVGYNVAQAEAKMMSYAIYGQQKTRDVGDVWSVDSATLESFFPLQSKKRKPFSFSGGQIVLTVESIDANGKVLVKSLFQGWDKDEGEYKTTNLNIEPRTTESDLRPSFSVNLGDTNTNFVRFTIDSRNEVCLRAEMQILLRNYKGALPNVEQFKLDGKEKDREVRASIQDGEIRLYCLITTSVEDPE